MIWTTLVVGKAGRRLADKCIPIPNNRLALDGPPLCLPKTLSGFIE
jgi:hypothetical protein